MWTGLGFTHFAVEPSTSIYLFSMNECLPSPPVVMAFSGLICWQWAGAGAVSIDRYCRREERHTTV